MAKHFEDEDLEVAEYDQESQETFEDEESEFAGLTEQDYAAMGINPTSPTKARPGSEAKVIMLSARYAAGLPLWHDGDCYEHGPRENDLMGFRRV